VNVNNSTNITKKNNNLSPKESLDSDGQQFINKTNNNRSLKDILNSDGQQFYQYQQNKQ
jgi:hypothetical protein